jgi:hypothetical protein
MKRQAQLLLAAMAFVGVAAAQPAVAASSGFQSEGASRKLPRGVPARVATANFSGPDAEQIRDDFSVGLMRLGFEVIEREHFDEIASELKLQQTGMISTATVKRLGEQLGVEGMFIGKVYAQRAGQAGGYVGIRLVDVANGKVLWSATGPSSESLIASLASDLNLAKTAKLPRARRDEAMGIRDEQPYASLTHGSIVTVETHDDHRYTLFFDKWDDDQADRLRFCFGVPPCPVDPFTVTAAELASVDKLSR